MELSVVVPTLNGREQLEGCLDALSTHATAEIIVVNGPSVDGTTGMVRQRDDVAVLVEVDDRNINVARNAGITRAQGEVIAFVDYWHTVEAGWFAALRSVFEPTLPAHRASGHGSVPPTAVTGPVGQAVDAERRTIGDRRVTYFDGGNVAVRAEVLHEIDGFDEYLSTGGARDAAHRIAGLGHTVIWSPEMRVMETVEPGTGVSSAALRADGGDETRDWYWRYRSLTYRLVKNYGFRSLWRVGRHVFDDVGSSIPNIARGETRPSGWLTNARVIANGSATGVKDGFIARLSDRSDRRNHRGLTSRADRAVAVYDRRKR